MSFPPYRLMTPGPVPLPKEVLSYLSRPMIHHRTPEFSQDLTYVLTELKTVFATHQPVFVMTSTASGAMEAALINTLSPGDEILVMESGKFSRRWSQIATAHGLKAHAVKEREGTPLSPQKVQATLEKQPQIKAVALQACETSTGTQNPVFAVSRVLQSFPNTLLMVDAATAIGAMTLKMDDWGLDVVVAGSQKAFMLPTGLGFISLSKRAWEFHKRATCPRFYFDLQAEWEANQKGLTRFSASVSHIRALSCVLKFFNKDLNIRARCQALALATRKAVKELGLELFSHSPCVTVTAITVPKDLDGEKVRSYLFDKFHISIAGGQDLLRGKIWRIGHLGYITDEDLVATIQGLGKSLLDMGWPLDEKQVERVAQSVGEQLKSSPFKEPFWQERGST